MRTAEQIQRKEENKFWRNNKRRPGAFSEVIMGGSVLEGAGCFCFYPLVPLRWPSWHFPGQKRLNKDQGFRPLLYKRAELGE